MAKRKSLDRFENGYGDFDVLPFNDVTIFIQNLQMITNEVYSEIWGNASNSSTTDQLFENLDGVKGESVAILLPIALAISLAISYLVLLPGAKEGPSLTSLFVNLQSASNFLVAFLFTKVEFQWLYSYLPKISSSSHASGERASLGLALPVAFITTALAFGSSLWPLQNLINCCITITMARALQLQQLSAVVLALVGLTLYDFLAVVGTQQFTDGGTSIMESVARAKINAPAVSEGVNHIADGFNVIQASSSIVSDWQAVLQSTLERLLSPNELWRPGLFQVSVGGRISDVLGIADVLFPSLLATWALRFDMKNDDLEDPNRPTFRAVLAGYLVGCLLCEIFQTGAGQPALVYIVPPTLLFLAISGIRQGRWRDMFLT